MKNNIFLTSESYVVLADLVKYIDVNKNKKVLFIDTSGEPFDGETPWIDKSKEEIERLGFDMIVYSITDKTVKEVEEVVAKTDIIHMAGGSAIYLLDKAYKVDFLRIMREFIKRGGIYIGQSAGSYLAGPSVEPALTSSRMNDANKLDDFKCAELVDFTVLPHFGREDTREKYLKHRCEHIFGSGDKIILLTDNQYVRVQEDGMYKIEEA